MEYAIVEFSDRSSEADPLAKAANDTDQVQAHNAVRLGQAFCCSYSRRGILRSCTLPSQQSLEEMHPPLAIMLEFEDFFIKCPWYLPAGGADNHASTALLCSTQVTGRQDVPPSWSACGLGLLNFFFISERRTEWAGVRSRARSGH